jgi:hypothetical protein
MKRFPQGVPGCPSCTRRSPITCRTTRSSDRPRAAGRFEFSDEQVSPPIPTSPTNSATSTKIPPTLPRNPTHHTHLPPAGAVPTRWRAPRLIGRTHRLERSTRRPTIPTDAACTIPPLAVHHRLPDVDAAVIRLAAPRPFTQEAIAARIYQQSDPTGGGVGR